MNSTQNLPPNTGSMTSIQNPGQAQLPTDEAPHPIQLPEGLVKAGGQEYVVSQYSKLRKQHTDWFKNELDRIEENYRLFENKAAAGIKAQGPIMPMVYSVVETKKARAMRDLMGMNKYFELMADGKVALDWQQRYEQMKAMSEQAAQMAVAGMPGVIPPPEMPDIAEVTGGVEDLLNEYISDTDAFYPKMDILYQSLELEKSMCAHVKWRGYKQIDLNLKKEPAAVGDGEVLTGQSFDQKEKGCPDFEPVSLREMAWDPRAKFSFEKATWISRRFMVRPSDLKDMEAKGDISNGNLAAQLATIDQNNTQAGPMGGEQGNADPVARQSKRVEGVNLPTGTPDDKLIPVDMVWGLVTWMEEGKFQSQDARYWIANEKTLLCYEPNTGPNGEPLESLARPFAFGTLNQKIDQLMGFGAVDAIKMLQVKIGNVIAAIDKLMWQTANSPIFYEPVSMLDGKKTLLDGANLVAVMSSKNINRMPPPSEAIGLLQNYLLFLMNELRQATASNDTAQGISEGSEGTATEATILNQSSDIRMQYGRNMINSSFFLQLGKLYRELVLQSGIDGELVTRESGVDGKPINIPLEWVAMRFIFKPSAAIPESKKLTQFRVLDEFIQKLIAIPAPLVTDEAGNQMIPALYNFIVEDMMPLVIGAKGKKLFRKAPMGLPGAPMPGGPGPEGEVPMEGAPIPDASLPPVEQAA